MFDDRLDRASLRSSTTDGYASDMAVSARDVAAAIRERLPGVPTKKLHKLLYYAQGHHLAAFRRPLFTESVSAFDMGPVVGQLWWAEKNDAPESQRVPLDEAQLNTVGYVLARYGRLSGRDLEILSHGERPWQRANQRREPGARVRIEQEWMEAYFLEPDEDELSVDAAAATSFLSGANERLLSGGRQDEIEEIRARLGAIA